jgi:hypothetical protein
MCQDSPLIETLVLVEVVGVLLVVVVLSAEHQLVLEVVLMPVAVLHFQVQPLELVQLLVLEPDVQKDQNLHQVV